MNTYGLSERRIETRKTTEQEHIEVTRHPYEVLLERIRSYKEHNGWMPLHITKMIEEFDLGRKNYQSDVIYALRCHPNIIAKEMPSTIQGKIQSVTQYKWVAEEEKNRLGFHALNYLNIGPGQIQRLQTFYANGLRKLNINDILCVYDYLVKSGAEDQWISFRPLTISSQRGIYMDHVLQVLNDFQQNRVALFSQVTREKSSAVNICHLVTEEHSYQSLLQEMVEGEAAQEYQEPLRKSRKKRSEAAVKETIHSAAIAPASIESQRKILKSIQKSPFLKIQDRKISKKETEDIDSSADRGIINVDLIKRRINTMIDEVVQRTYQESEERLQELQQKLDETEAQLKDTKARFHIAAKENYDMQAKFKEAQESYRALLRKQKQSDLFLKQMMQHTSDCLTDMQAHFLTILGGLSTVRRDQLSNPSFLNRIKMEAFRTIEEASKDILNYSPDRLPPEEKH